MFALPKGRQASMIVRFSQYLGAGIVLLRLLVPSSPSFRTTSP